MADYDRKLAAALEAKTFDAARELDQAFGRTIGIDPDEMEARKAATRAKYSPKHPASGDLRKADEPAMSEANILKALDRIEREILARCELAHPGRRKR